jgi:hypothetical protein
MLVRSRNHTVKEHEVLRPLMYVYGQISPELLIMPDRQRRIPCQGSILPSGMTKLTEVRVCKVDLTEHGVPCSIWSPDRVGAEEQGCQARRTRFEVAIVANWCLCSTRVRADPVGQTQPRSQGSRTRRAQKWKLKLKRD